MTEVEDRQYDPTACHYLEIEGQTFGHLTARQMAGFAKGQNYSMWEFECDCGNTVIRSGPHTVHAAKHADDPRYFSRLHCGCRLKFKRHGLSRTPVHNYWFAFRHEFCEEWAKDLVRFDIECYSQKPKGTWFLLRPDKIRPLGPDNFRWDKHREAHYLTIEKCAGLLVKHQGMEPEEALERCSSFSRQRRFQLIYKYEGKCTYCGKPRSGSSATFCESCRLKHNARKAREWRLLHS
jgi:hypothetical protein